MQEGGAEVLWSLYEWYFRPCSMETSWILEERDAVVLVSIDALDIRQNQVSSYQCLVKWQLTYPQFLHHWNLLDSLLGNGFPGPLPSRHVLGVAVQPWSRTVVIRNQNNNDRAGAEDIWNFLLQYPCLGYIAYEGLRTKVPDRRLIAAPSDNLRLMQHSRLALHL